MVSRVLGVVCLSCPVPDREVKGGEAEVQSNLNSRVGRSLSGDGEKSGRLLNAGHSISVIVA